MRGVGSACARAEGEARRYDVREDTERFERFEVSRTLFVERRASRVSVASPS